MITFVSENYSLQDSIIGLGAFAFYFALGLVMLFVYSKIYLAVTPHDEIALIKENKLSAGVSFAGSMIGFCFPLITSMNQSPCVADFLLWSVISIVAQIVGFLLVRLVFPKVSERIENNEVAVGVYLAAFSICVGLISSASMTY